MEIITRLPGCPSNEDFQGLEENPACITSVKKVIPLIKGHMQLLPGYKSFDISTGFYNSINKKKKHSISDGYLQIIKTLLSFKSLMLVPLFKLEVN
jgi:hypothetical protein